MTPDEIKLGQTYINPIYPGCVWLGCGMRILWSKNYKDKDLVLIQNPDGPIGAKFQQGENVFAGYWDTFEEVNLPT